MVDLWPETIQRPDMTMPLAILKEQAALLGKKTKNVVEAEVSKVVPDIDSWPFELGLVLGYSFYIMAPLLSGYRYSLFTIWHGIEPYPLKIILDSAIMDELIKKRVVTADQTRLTVSSEEQFIELLRLVFNSEKTKRVIQSIMAQSEIEASPQQG